MFEKVVTEHGLSETEFWTSVIGTEGVQRVNDSEDGMDR